MDKQSKTTIQSEEALAVPTPWHRTVYEESGKTAESGVMQIARRLVDVALGPPLAVFNASIHTMEEGVKLGAGAAGSVAKALPAWVIGARLIAGISGRVEARAAKAASDAGDISIKSLEAASGASEANKAGKLAADTLLGPAMGVAAWPITVAVDVADELAETGAGKVTTKSLASLLNSLLDAFSVSRARTDLDTSRIRETWMAMTTGPGKSALGDVINLNLGAFRLAFGDTKSLGEALETGVINMNYGLQYGSYGLLYPKVPIGEVLSDTAGLIVDHQPATFVSALRTGDLWAAINATMEDVENVFAFAALYPAGLILVAGNIVRFLSMGLRDCNGVEAYIKAEQQIVEKHPELRGEAALTRLMELPPATRRENRAVQELEELEKERPFTCTEFEFYVGNAKSKTDPQGVACGLLSHPNLPVGVFPQELIDLAQDTAFWYSAKILGREKALLRMYRLYGEGVRDRLAKDPTLETDAGLGKAQAQALVEKHKNNLASLQELKNTSEERLKAFGKLESNPDTYVPGHVKERKVFFLELQAQADGLLRAKLERRPRATASRKAS